MNTIKERTAASVIKASKDLVKLVNVEISTNVEYSI